MRAAARPLSIRCPAVVFFFFSLAFPPRVGFCQDEESLGKQAEQAGKLREAVTHYTAALKSAPEGSDAEQRLREEIIVLVPKLKPPPAVPSEVIDHEGRAEAAVKTATKKEDFLDAASEYRKALRLAPWLAQDYFNLGVVLEKAGSLDEVIRSFRLYLLAAPNAQDATEVRKKIAGLQYEIEKVAKEKTEAEAQQKEQARAEQERRDKLSWLLGTWNLKEVIDIAPGVNSTLWGTFEFALKDHAIEGYKLETRRSDFGRAPQSISSPKPYLVLRGELQAGDPSTIRWTTEDSEFGGRYCDQLTRKNWADVSLEVSYDKRTINFRAPNARGGPSDQCKSSWGPFVLTR